MSIKLKCSCGREMDYDRSIDPDLPPEVVTIRSTACDQCDSGDFATETWFDEAGDVVVPDWAR